MANPYYENSASDQRFIEGEDARGTDVDAKFDGCETGFEEVYADILDIQADVVLGGPAGGIDIREMGLAQLILFFYGG